MEKEEGGGGERRWREGEGEGEGWVRGAYGVVWVACGVLALVGWWLFG